MMVKLLFPILLMVSVPIWGQPNCVEDKHCASQLIRVQIANNVLQRSAQTFLPALQNFAQSSTLPNLIERSYNLQPILFPHSKEKCEREKANNTAFANINCSENGLCSKTDLNETVRDSICFNLPCPLMEGTLNEGKCNQQEKIFPNGISFPDPVTISRIRLNPTKVEFENNKANICFRINELSLNVGVRLGLDTRRTQLPDKHIDVRNISPSLDGPRDVCMSADVNLGSATPITNLKVSPQGNSPFISDQMIRNASQGLSLSGLSGYPADQLERIKGEIVPVIFQPLRDTVEDAVTQSLGEVFQSEINRLTGQFAAGSSHLVNGRNISSEIGYGNIQIRKQLAITECSALAAARRPIPPNHECIGINHYGSPITTQMSGTSLINELMDLERLSADLQITSESVKQRLIALKEVVSAQVNEFARPDDPDHFRQAWTERVEKDIERYIDPLINRIAQTQLEGEVINFIEIQNQLQNGASRNVGVSVPDICSDRNPSPHARRSMNNCPIQAYVDLNEMNQVMDRLWRAGRICQRGKGPYEQGTPRYNNDGSPNGSGCYFEAGGMGCYLNNPPQIKYNTKTKKYDTSIQLKDCYRGPVILGQGRLGGDFKIDYSFTPKACHGGDLCMDSPSVKWEVVPGTARYALRESSSLNGVVMEKIQEAIDKNLSEVIRIPLASGVGPLANIPLESEGRVDTGPGFFGACLKVKESAGVSGQ